MFLYGITWLKPITDVKMLSFSNILDKFLVVDSKAPTITGIMPQLAEFHLQVNIFVLFFQQTYVCESLESPSMATSTKNTFFHNRCNIRSIMWEMMVCDYYYYSYLIFGLAVSD